MPNSFHAGRLTNRFAGRLTTMRPRPRARATLLAALFAAVLALAELGILIPGAGLSARCDLRLDAPSVDVPSVDAAHEAA